MSQNRWWAKTLRFLSIVLLGITAFFTLASGAGTACVALDPTGFGENMALLAPFQWAYIAFVIITSAIGVLMVSATVLLSRGLGKGYRQAIQSLVLGIIVGVIHIFVSRALRGSSMPVDAVVYTTILTLIVFLLLRLPPVWNAVRFDRIKGSGDEIDRIAGAFTLLACGLLTLTVQYWAGPTHTWDGTNWADAWRASMWILGSGFILGGLGGAFWHKLPLANSRLNAVPDHAA